MTNILTEAEKIKLDDFCETYRFHDGFVEFSEAQFHFCLSKLFDENRIKQLDMKLALKDFEADYI
jgi:hypothetical protein